MSTPGPEDPSQESSFQNISLGGKPTVSNGILKMNKSGIGWRGRNGQTTSLVGSDISEACWTRIGVSFQLRVSAKNGSVYKFDGFRDPDFPVIRKFFSELYKVPILESSVSSLGWNWGTAEVSGSNLKFDVENKPSFEIPLTDATSANVNKQEVSIIFNPPESGADDGDCLAEIRFFVPNTRESKADEDEIPEYNEELLHTPAEALADKILDHIEVLPGNAQPLIQFEHLAMSTPRGHCDLEMHPSFFFLAGKNYRVDFGHVTRLFLLPQASGKQASFVVSLDPPIRQGSTSYPLIVFQVPTNEVEVNLNQEGIPEGSKAAALGTNLKGQLHEIVARVFGVLVDKKVTVPGATGFKSTKGESFVPCKYKTGDGNLYPLENSFICVVAKNPVHIPFADISSIVFESVSREITLSIILRSGVVHNFPLIPATEHALLIQFCKSKSIKVEGDMPVLDTARIRSQRPSALASRSATRTEIQSKPRHHDDDDDDDESDDEFEENEEDFEDEEPSEDESANEEEFADAKKRKSKKSAKDSDAESGDEPPKKKKKKSESDSE